jgi:selenocysteine lyase/cysteine desulfurase
VTSYKRLFSRALAAAPGRLHFAAHSHHLWPDVSYDGQMAAWDDAAALADRKWEKIFGEAIPCAQAHVARELRLPDPRTVAFGPNTHELLVRLFSAKGGRAPLDVLTTDGEFHSFRRQAARWAEDGRVALRVVPCEPFETFTERYLAAAREKAPDIAFLSHIMFKRGLRFDGIEELAQIARPDGPWVVLDLYHSFMAIPCDFSRVADRVFLLGGGGLRTPAGSRISRRWKANKTASPMRPTADAFSARPMMSPGFIASTRCGRCWIRRSSIPRRSPRASLPCARR